MQDGTVQGYLSTAVYATPQDPLFQESGLRPLLVYFHIFTMARSA
jgi:hypothetical protein